MVRDQHGLEMTAADSSAVKHYDRAIDELLHFRAAMLDEANAAAAADPACPMAAALGAYLRLLSTEPAESVIRTQKRVVERIGGVTKRGPVAPATGEEMSPEAPRYH